MEKTYIMEMDLRSINIALKLIDNTLNFTNKIINQRISSLENNINQRIDNLEKNNNYRIDTLKYIVCIGFTFLSVIIALLKFV